MRIIVYCEKIHATRFIVVIVYCILTMPKRKCIFNEDLQRKYPSFKKGKFEWEVLCLICSSTISIANKGGSDIADHIATNKHKRHLQSQAGTSNTIDTFFKPSSDENSIRAAEGAIAFHNVCHHMSFNSMDCTLTVNRKIYHDSNVGKRITCNRTKATAIISKVLAPLSINNVMMELRNVSFLSVSTDASNHGAIKLFPIIIQYFNHYEGGMSFKLLDILTPPNETSDTITELLVSALEKLNILQKCIAFGGDNCNTNFGGRQRAGKNNVFAKLKTRLGKEIVGVGCSAHIIHNAVHHASNGLPVDVETIILKIYNYFSVYTVRTEALKEFCSQAETEYNQLLYHSKTRWLSLFPAIERILGIFEPLKAYFSTIERPPVVLNSFFEDDYSEAYLFFIHSAMSVFHTNIERMERQDNSVIETRNIILNVKKSIEQRLEQNFKPMKIREILRKLQEAGKNTEHFTANMTKFYTEICDYLNLWIEPFEEFQIFEWMDFTKLSETNWESIAPSIEYLSNKEVQIDDCFI